MAKVDLTQIGVYVVIIGLLVAVLPFFGVTLRVTSWLEESQLPVGVGLAVIGGVLIGFDLWRDQRASEAAAKDRPLR